MRWDAYLASLPIKASPLLRLLDNIAQLLIGQLQVLRQEVRPLLGCEPLKDVQHATIVVESGRWGEREEVRRGGSSSRCDTILNHCIWPVKVTWGQMAKQDKTYILIIVDDAILYMSSLFHNSSLLCNCSNRNGPDWLVHNMNLLLISHSIFAAWRSTKV